MSNSPRLLEPLLFVLVLIAGLVLRFARLSSVPESLTDEEAAHLQDAADILNGDWVLLFDDEHSLREPLYAVLLAPILYVTGYRAVAGRLFSAMLGTFLLVLIYAWVRLYTRNRWLALVTMAGLAVSFWGVSTSRMGLRGVIQPVLYVGAAIAMRRGIVLGQELRTTRRSRYRPTVEVESRISFIVSGLLLGLSFYSYANARIMWLVFPAFFLFLSIDQPGVLRRAWPGLVVMLLIGAVVGSPIIAELIGDSAFRLAGGPPPPVETLLAQDFYSVRDTLLRRLGILTIRGDTLWQYSIPGRPLLGPLNSLLFYLGVSIAVISLIMPYRPARRGKTGYTDVFHMTSANMFMLLTLAAGMAPVIIYGPVGSSLSAMGIQPALYYFPALAVLWAAEWAMGQVGPNGRTAIYTAYAIMVCVVGIITAHDYFISWGQAERVQQEYYIEADDLSIRALSD